MTACPDENTFADFLAGGLPVTSRRRIEEHIDRCERCGGAVAAVARAAVSGERPAVGLLPAREGEQLGRYRLGERIGAGAMGVVFRAHDAVLDREVALKLLAPGTGRGLQEARALARFNHPNVVTVHDVGEQSGQLFIAMELVHGVTLGEWLARAPRAWEDVTRIFLAAARGLAAAHDLGVVHRDFKPANVLVDHAERVVITDFGLAGALPPADPALHPAWHEGATATGAVLGTPAYMAPEQREGSASASSDQYAFAVTFHEALRGVRPAADLSRAGGPPRESDTTGAPIPDWLTAIVERALQRDPARRYPSLHALIADLEHHLARRASAHIRVNAWLQLIMCPLHAALTGFVIWANSLPDETVSAGERAEYASSMSFVIAALIVFLTLCGWAPIGAVWTPLNAWGLFKGKRWAVTSTIIYALLSLPTCLGTPYAIYALTSLWKHRRQRTLAGGVTTRSERN